MKRFTLLFGCFFAMTFLSEAQTDIFSTSLGLFNSEKYSEAQNYIENQFLLNPNLSEENVVLLAKIYNKTSQFEKTKSLTANSKIKTANNIQEFWYEIGYAEFQLEDYFSTLSSWIKSFQAKPENGSFVKENILLLITQKLDTKAIYETDKVKSLIDAMYEDPFKTELIELLSDVKSQSIKEIRIGLLLPLGKGKQNPSERELIGRDILHGFLVGMDELPIKSTVPELIFIRDTEGDSLKAEKMGRELLEEKKVNLIIGPVFSNECAGIAELAEQFKVPVISPTASDDAIGRFKNYFFQINPSLGVRGRQSALKALEIRNIEKDTVLVLAEAASETLSMADAFAVAMHEDSVAVVDRVVFEYGSEDIRRFLPYIQKDTTQIKDIIYAPIEDESLINIIVPQLSYLKVFGMYVGNNSWDDRLKLRPYKRILDGMLICKDWNIDTNRVEVKNYVRDYFKRFYSKPATVSYRGFDSFLLVKNLIESNAIGQPDIDIAIRNTPPIIGLQNTIDFRGQTINQHLTYFRYINNEIIPAENVEQIRPDK